MSDKVKPCPFCGGRAYLYHSVGQIYWYTCESCKAETRASGSPAGALVIWNTRIERQPADAGKESRK